MINTLALHGERMSMIWEECGDAPPRWRHWGGRITSHLPFRLDAVRSAASFSFDTDIPFDLAPAYGNGWFGPSGLIAHRSGRQLTRRWTVISIELDGHSLAVRLCDRQADIELKQNIAIDPVSDVATLSASVVNHGDEPISIEWLASAMLPLPSTAVSIRSFSGRHNAELVETTEPMPRHGWRREQRRGITGHSGPPGLFVLGDGSGWDEGEVWAMQLAWSGNHILSVERDDEGSWAMLAGEALAPGEVVLECGQHYDTPELLVTFSAQGLNRASQNFHAAIRSRMDWPGGAMRPRPVHLNSWEGFYFDHDEARLRDLANGAAEIGIERFVLDDGWFHGRTDDRAGLGDWIADRAKYPSGLRPLADHVVSLGMEFGLWVEPEMANPDSDLLRAHPDWVLGSVENASLPTARNQLLLDLSRPDVGAFLFDALDRLLADLPISYLKWDHNRDLAPLTGSDGRASGHAQVKGAYALIDRLRAAHPLVEIEACAGGGGRSDAGMATRTHRFWTSDNLDAVSRIAIQRGFLHFLPPELMGAHVGASPAHATARSQSLGFRSAIALPGHFGVELDPASLSPGERILLAAAIERYKQLRNALHGGRTWLGEGGDAIRWHAVGEPERMHLFVIRTDPILDRRPQPLPLPMFRGQGTLLVSLLDLAGGGAAMPLARWFEEVRQSPQMVDGDWLAEVGLPIPPMKAETVAIFSIGLL